MKNKLHPGKTSRKRVEDAYSYVMMLLKKAKEAAGKKDIKLAVEKCDFEKYLETAVNDGKISGEINVPYQCF